EHGEIVGAGTGYRGVRNHDVGLGRTGTIDKICSAAASRWWRRELVLFGFSTLPTPKKPFNTFYDRRALNIAGNNKHCIVWHESRWVKLNQPIARRCIN